MAIVLNWIVLLAWALWFGGLATIFLVATNNFEKFDRKLAGDVNLAMFAAFERWELLLAAIAVTASAVLLWTAWRRTRAALLMLLGLAGVGVLISVLWVSPGIERLRADGRVGTPEWGMMHGMSMVVYTSQTALLLLAGFLLPFIRANRAEPSGRGPGLLPADQPIRAEGTTGLGPRSESRAAGE